MSDKTNVKSDPVNETKPEDLTPEELEQISGGSITGTATVSSKHTDWIEV